MIGAKTRLMDCWQPQLEWIRMPELQFRQNEYWAKLNAIEPPSNSARAFTLPRLIRPQHEALQLHQPFIDLRSHGPHNIAHAIVGGLIGFLGCQHAASQLGLADDLVAVIAANVASYVKDVYTLLGISVVQTDGPVSGMRMQCNFDDLASVGLAQSLLPRKIAAMMEEKGKSVPGRIYLARHGSRSISNSAEIETLLRSEGFVTIYPERLPVLEQFRLLWHAETVIGVHGAGLAPLLLRSILPNRRPLQLIEIFGPGYVVSLYRHIVAAIGGQWVGVRGQISPEVIQDLDVNQGSGIWRRVCSKFHGRLPGRFLVKERAWQRTHQSSSFTVDPESVVASLAVLKSGLSEPTPRVIQFPLSVT
ncbi:MAG: glycosyltransferase family 61 protein [Planctomycetales bacterium]|nr:glycosyltransferase family 61 protein [Planctomycetales bacterium]